MRNPAYPFVDPYFHHAFGCFWPRLILRPGAHMLALHAVLLQLKHIEFFQSLGPEPR